MGGRSSSVGNRTRRSPVGRPSARRRVRSAPKPKVPTRRVSAPTIPPEIMKQIQERIQSLPKKAPAKKTKPVARRRPAVQPVRKKPAVKKPVARKRPVTRIGELGRESYPGMPDIPKSVQKRIQEMIASGQIKAPTTSRKTTPRKTTPKKTAPKKTAPKKTAPKKIADSSSPVFKLPKRDFSRFEGQPGSGRVSSGTTVFDRYDPETDTYYGTIGGFAGSMPTSVKGSEVGETFKKNWAAANKGYTPPKQQTTPQKKSPYTGPPLYEEGITGVEAARRFKEYAEANNIKMDGNTPIFSSKAQRDAAYAAGYRGTGKIKLSKADIEASRKRQEEEARRPVGNLRSDMLGQLFASGVMDPDKLKRKLINDDFFVDKTGIFGEKGKKYNIQLPKDQINLAHTKFTMTPPPPPPKMEGRYVPPTSSLGTPDSLIPSNIVGQSYNPYAASMARSMQPPQPPGSTFGGYGQQAPMTALAPYAGMAQSNPQPTDFFPTYVPRPDPVFEQAPSPPKTQPNAEPFMSAPRPVFVAPRPPGARIGLPLGRDQITEFLPYR